MLFACEIRKATVFSCSNSLCNVNIQGPQQSSAEGWTQHWADVPDAVGLVVVQPYIRNSLVQHLIDQLMVVGLAPMHCTEAYKFPITELCRMLDGFVSKEAMPSCHSLPWTCQYQLAPKLWGFTLLWTHFTVIKWRQDHLGTCHRRCRRKQQNQFEKHSCWN